MGIMAYDSEFTFVWQLPCKQLTTSTHRCSYQITVMCNYPECFQDADITEQMQATQSHCHRTHRHQHFATWYELQNCTYLVSTTSPPWRGWRMYASGRYHHLRESWTAPSWYFHTDSTIRCQQVISWCHANYTMNARLSHDKMITREHAFINSRRKCYANIHIYQQK